MVTCIIPKYFRKTIKGFLNPYFLKAFLHCLHPLSQIFSNPLPPSSLLLFLLPSFFGGMRDCTTSHVLFCLTISWIYGSANVEPWYLSSRRTLLCVLSNKTFTEVWHMTWFLAFTVIWCHMHAHMRTHTHARTRADTDRDADRNTSTDTITHTDIHKHVHINACVRTCIPTCLCMHTGMSTHSYSAHLHTYEHAHIHACIRTAYIP